MYCPSSWSIIRDLLAHAKVQVPAAQDFPALCQPYASLHTASSQIAARPRPGEKSAKLACMRCVDSNLAVFTKSLEVSSTKNTVCLPAPIQILKKNNTNIVRRILRGRNMNFGHVGHDGMVMQAMVDSMDGGPSSSDSGTPRAPPHARGGNEISIFLDFLGFLRR
jgi:hypothetical protein